MGWTEDGNAAGSPMLFGRFTCRSGRPSLLSGDTTVDDQLTASHI